MKNVFLFALLIALAQACTTSDSIFELSPAQSMSITGKGVGQDAAYNPYSNGNSFAVVNNLGENEFKVRVQKDGKIIDNITVQPDEKRDLLLRKGYELYLDSNLESKARVIFKKDKSR